jgi:adenylate cyclase
LFADLVGYTTMVESYGSEAENVRALVTECFEVLAGRVLSHGGTVEKFIGDAVCALFGAPTAHEDDPERALACALEMQLAIDRMNQQRLIRTPPREPLALRIGISTGEVVGGTTEHGGERQYSVTGDAVNTASRLQAAALPGQILASDTTERLARSRFAFEAGGEIKLKGKRKPTATFRLVGPRREESAANIDLVNRHDELERLDYTLKRAGLRDTQLVEIVGDAGVGKTRLVTAFNSAAGTEAIVAHGTCPPMATSQLFPFQSIATALVQACREVLGTGVSAQRHEVALEELLLNAAPEDVSAVDAIVSGIRNVVKHLETSAPVVIAVENIQRADPLSIEVLKRLASTVGNTRLLLVWTRRTGEETPLDADYDCSFTRLVVKPLSAADSGRLMKQMLGDRTVPESLANLIVDRSAGNPLYIEAMTRMLIEDEDLFVSGQTPETLQIPHTVQGLIQARLDSIPEGHRLALQEAAVVGRDFDAELLQRVDLFGIDIPSTLDAVVRTGMIEHVGESAYRFRHVLTQEVAYDGMLQALRSELHREVAEALVDMFPDRAVELAPVIADHYAKAGDTDRAVEILVQAGQGQP